MFAALPILALASVAVARPLNFARAVDVNSTVFTSQTAWYYQNGNAGACGNYSSDADLVVGLPSEVYGDLGAVSPFCGKYVNVTNTANNITITAKVADASATDGLLTLSVASWKALKGDDQAFTAKWLFVNATGLAVPSTTSTTYHYEPTTTSSEYKETTTYVAAAASPTTEEKKTTTTWQPEPTTTKPTTTWTPEAATTTTYWTPTTTKTTQAYVAPTTTQQQQSSGGGGQYSGQATFYYQGGVAGSCGTVHGDYDYIVAMNTAQNPGSHCWQYVQITNTQNGRSVRAQVVDTCPGCGYGSLDLSVGAFNAIGDASQGVLPISWSFA
ncbi:barwin-like endoglucanase [Meredithblackwellia eburnea MCA 4105]